MLQAMLQAQVGDDVFGEDPTINQLEAMTAEMFGMQAALFCPSGTMTNQIAIKCHTQPGDEVICDELSHVYQYEGGGIAFNSGCSVRLLQGNRGRITAQQVEAAINPDDVHKPVSKLVSIENTANRGGGSCYDFAELERIGAVCSRYGLAYHLDGARLWNALVAKGETAQQYGKLFDSISVCLSKGLGTPVGSLLLGTTAFINKARRIRKVLGGGMRQAGYLAAAGIFALQYHINRLAQDHAHAAQAAKKLGQLPWLKNILPTETNILIFDVTEHQPASYYTNLWKQHGLLCLPVGSHSIRMVFHLGVTDEHMPALLQILENTPATKL
jgi:threonine aldolase